jgi:hypothetical protein
MSGAQTFLTAGHVDTSDWGGDVHVLKHDIINININTNINIINICIIFRLTVFLI